MSKLIGSGAAGKALGIDSNTVRRAVRLGQLRPAVRTPGGQLRFEQSEIDRFKIAAVELPGNPSTNDARPLPLPPLDDYAAAREHILNDLVETGGRNIWRPARTKKQIWSAGPIKPFSDSPKLLNDNLLEQVLGFGRRELHHKIVSSSLEDVAKVLNVTPTTLRRFCAAYRIPVL